MSAKRLAAYVVFGLLAVAAVAGMARWRYVVTRPDNVLLRGQEALRHGDRDEADRRAAQLEAAGAIDHARLLSAEIYYSSRRFADAIRELNKIATEGELRLQAAALGGACLFSLGDFREAERHFLYVLDQWPDHLRAHRGLADIYYHQGAHDQAVHHLEQVVRLDPDDGRPHQHLGYILQDQDQKAEAAAAYRRALERTLTAEAAAGVRRELAQLLTEQGDCAGALDVLDGFPPDRLRDDPALAALRGECLWTVGRREEGVALLDQALSRHPQSAELLRARAKVHLHANENAPAAALLEKALAHDRHDFITRHLLAQAYEGVGRKTDAAKQRQLVDETQKHLAELTRLNHEATGRPWDAAVRRRLAELCEQLGKHDLAVMWREAAAACRPQGE
jgi:tetratricopeptide (TPR) repeat protein